MSVRIRREVVSGKAAEPRTEVFQFIGGIIDFVKYLNKGKETLNEPIYFSAENADGTVEVAMQWSTSYSTNSVHGLRRTTSTRTRVARTSTASSRL